MYWMLNIIYRECVDQRANAIDTDHGANGDPGAAAETGATFYNSKLDPQRVINRL